LTRIVHTIVLEGEDEEVWPFNKDLKTHIQLLKDSADKDGKVLLTHEYERDDGKSGGSNAMKLAGLAGKGLKAGWDFLFKEEKDSGQKAS
jgi:hypothetical protein